MVFLSVCLLNYLTDSLTESMVLCYASGLSKYKMNPTLQGFRAGLVEKTGCAKLISCNAGQRGDQVAT